MIDEIIFAVYESPARANAAVEDLRLSEIPEAFITHHAPRTRHVAGEHRVERGMRSWLFGSEAGGEGALYDADLPDGATVVTVRVNAAQADGVVEILDNHGPVDVDERALVAGESESTTAPADTQAGGVEADIPLRAHGISEGSWAPRVDGANVGRRVHRYVVAARQNEGAR
jgi:hypothetical protein